MFSSFASLSVSLFVRLFEHLFICFYSLFTCCFGACLVKMADTKRMSDVKQMSIIPVHPSLHLATQCAEDTHVHGNDPRVYQQLIKGNVKDSMALPFAGPLWWWRQQSRGVRAGHCARGCLPSRGQWTLCKLRYPNSTVAFLMTREMNFLSKVVQHDFYKCVGNSPNSGRVRMCQGNRNNWLLSLIK